MKKYKLLKDIPFHNKWTVFIFDWYSAYVEWEEDHLVSHPFEDEDFKSLLWIWYEEILEEPKHKFKVWDYVVKDDRFKCKDWLTWKIYYIKINYIRFDEYLKCFLYNSYKEEELRSPTKEELEKYFR